MDRAISLCLLGTPTIHAAGVALDVAATRAVPLLALLAASEGRVPRERIAQLLWRRVEPAAALASLRQLLHHLPEPLHRAIEAERASLALDTAKVECDLWRLRAAPDAQSMLSCYAAPLLDGRTFDDFPEFDDWLRLERGRLAARVRSAIQSEMAALEPARALELARRWLAIEPADEEMHARLMEIHVAAGRIASAEAQYEALRRVLATVAGRAPQAATRAILEQALRRQGAPRGVGITPVATSFVGRQGELAEIARLAADPHCRLVTLHGPGGVGKTRLAMAFAEEAARHGEAVRYAGLEAAQAGQAFYAAVAAALEIVVSPRADPRARILEAAAPLRTFLVLDNFEQLVSQAGESQPALFVAELLRAAPCMKVLVTSRVALGLQEEWLLPVEGLPYPSVEEGGGAEAAVELFITRARQAWRGFSGTVERPHIVAICRAAEGLPLAIELAAAQVGTRPCAEIAHDLLAEPQPRALNRPDRQASVLRVVDQSLAAASEEQVRAFAALSLFQGAFDAAQAFAVARVGEGMMAELAARALLQRTGEGFRMHPLLRQVAARRLAKGRAVARRVEEGYVAEMTRRAAIETARVLGREAAASLATVDARFDDELHALRLAAALVRREHVETLAAAIVLAAVARGRVRAALEGWPDPAGAHLDSPTRTTLLLRRGDLHRHTGDFNSAIADYRAANEALGSLEEPALRFAILTGESGVQIWSGEYAQAVLTCERALAMPRGVSNLATRTRLIATLGTALAELGQHDRAQAMLDDATEEALQAGVSASVLALVLNASGGVSMYRGDMRRCIEAHRQALARLEADGFEQMRSTHFVNLGGAALDLEDLDEAERAFEEAVRIAQSYGDRGPHLYALVGVGNVALRRGDLGRAEAVGSEARLLSRAVGSLPIECEATTIVVRARIQRGDVAGALALLQEQQRDTRGQDLGFRGIDMAFSALMLAALGDAPPPRPELERQAAALMAAPTCTPGIRHDIQRWLLGGQTPEFVGRNTRCAGQNQGSVP